MAWLVNACADCPSCEHSWQPRSDALGQSHDVRQALSFPFAQDLRFSDFDAPSMCGISIPCEKYYHKKSLHWQCAPMEGYSVKLIVSTRTPTAR